MPDYSERYPLLREICREVRYRYSPVLHEVTSCPRCGLGFTPPSLNSFLFSRFHYECTLCGAVFEFWKDDLTSSDPWIVRTSSQLPIGCYRVMRSSSLLEGGPILTFERLHRLLGDLNMRYESSDVVCLSLPSKMHGWRMIYLRGSPDPEDVTESQ